MVDNYTRITQLMTHGREHSIVRTVGRYNCKLSAIPGKINRTRIRTAENHLWRTYGRE